MNSLKNNPVTRRMFMKTAPGVVVAGQQVAAAEIKKLAQKEARNASALVANQNIGYGPPAIDEDSAWSRLYRESVGYLRKGVVPKHLSYQIEREARYRSVFIEPDIDALVSLSEGQKRRMQYERSVKDVIAERIDSYESNEVEKSLLKKMQDSIKSVVGL